VVFDAAFIGIWLNCYASKNLNNFPAIYNNSQGQLNYTAYLLDLGAKSGISRKHAHARTQRETNKSTQTMEIRTSRLIASRSFLSMHCEASTRRQNIGIEHQQLLAAICTADLAWYEVSVLSTSAPFCSSTSKTIKYT
jgi:sensor c-di-GMP phosphodiesterase-like protein